MTFIRQFFKGLMSILEKVSAEDARALLCAAGINNFELMRLSANAEAEEIAAGQDAGLLQALCLEAECPVWSWKGQTVGASFVWKNEADLNVRDWIYLV
jgi:hypothetical protein